MPGGDVLARKHAVDEHTEFGIPELARSEITSAAVGQNIIPCIFEKKDVATDRLAFDNDAVISVEIAGDILLFKRVVVIAVLFQNLQNAQKRQLFRLE